MALARDLVELESQLRERIDVDLFAPIERSGLLSTPECAAMLARISAVPPGGTGSHHAPMSPSAPDPERRDATEAPGC